MASVMSDADILIDTIRRHEPSRSRVRELIAAGELATSAVTVFELYVGARTNREAEGIRDLLEFVEVFELDRAAAVAGAGVYRLLRSAGLRIGEADCMVAGTALTNGLALLTRNIRHFERVPGLSIVSI